MNDEGLKPTEVYTEGTDNMWFPVDALYKGRTDEPYAEHAGNISREILVERVQVRAREDGEWVNRQNMPQDAAELMAKMIEWVSKPDVIVQCYEARLEYNPTVDDVCRELGKASQQIAARLKDG